MSNNKFAIKAVKIMTPGKPLDNGLISIENQKIKDINDTNKVKTVFDLGDKIVFPGMINSHDHLLGTYYPRIGNGPYLNWLPWDNDLKSSPVYAERSKIPPKIIYMLGALRNLIAGTTTVSDHIPHFVSDPYVGNLPIRVMKNYTLAHECSEYDLKWGDGIDIEHKRAVKNDLAFITHIEEGYDGEAEEGIDVLMKYKALSNNTVLIHAIALSDKDIKLVSKNKANLVWCPNSNIFMFNRTGNVKKWLKNNINVALGTDSPMSGGMNLLDELTFAKKTYKKDNKSEIDDKILVDMVTQNAANAFRLGKQLGSIERNKIADLLVINGDKNKPYSSLVNAKLEDIALVFYGGQPLYGDKEYKDIFKKLGTKTTKIKIGKKDKLCVGNPAGLMKEIRKLVGFKKTLPFLPID